MPQHKEESAMLGTSKPISFMYANGPGTLITIGMFNSVAVTYPGIEYVSQTIMSGFTSLTLSRTNGCQVSMNVIIGFSPHFLGGLVKSS